MSHAAPPPSSDSPSETSLDRLLTTAEASPRMAEPARARVLQSLQAHASLRARAQESSAGPRARKRSGPAGWVLLAAACLSVLLAGLWHRASDPMSPQQYDNPGPGPMSVILADGSRAILDQGAQLVESAPRELELLQGRAYFDVAAKPEPFAITTDQGAAIARGTRFVLAVTGERSEALVEHGSVELVSTAASTRIRRGEIGVLDGDGATRETVDTTLAHAIAWIRPELRAEAEAEHLPEPAHRGTLFARNPRSGAEWPLPVRAFHVDVHIEDGMARTTIDQTFFNPANRQLEGVYSIALPADAAISRLAMYVDGKLMEGGIVERDRGRDVYESIVHVRRDPALLEWMSAGSYRIRIFPLPARQEKRIFVSYTQALEPAYDRTELTIPIPAFDDTVDDFEVRVRIAGGADLVATSPTHAMHAERDGDDLILHHQVGNATVGRDLSLVLLEDAPDDASTPELVTYDEGAHSYFSLRASLEWPTAPTPAGRRSWIFLYDTSGSQSPATMAQQSELLQSLLAHVEADDEVGVVAFDLAPQVLLGGFRTGAEVDWSDVADALPAEAAGLTRLDHALRAARELADDAAFAPTLVYMGDGLPTGTAASPSQLAGLLGDDLPLFAALVGDATTGGVVGEIATLSGGYASAIDERASLRWQALELVSRIASPRLTDLQARLSGDGLGEGAVYLPRTLAAGQELRAVGQLPQGASPRELHVSGRLGDDPFERTFQLDAPKPGKSYLPRLVAERRIAEIARHPTDAGRKEMAQLGMDHFLVTPETSLIVLETDAMYEEFAVRRSDASGWASYPAPSHIESRTEPSNEIPWPAGRRPVHRSAEPLWAASASYEGIGLGSIGTIGFGLGARGASFRQNSNGLGLGLLGTGVGGGGNGFGQAFGSGHGRLGGALKGAPRVRMGAALPPPVTTRFLAEDRKKRDWSVSTGEKRSPDVGATSDSERSLLASHALLPEEVPDVLDSQPVAMHRAYDSRLDDLTRFVPALFHQSIDAVEDEAATVVGSRPVEPSPDAEARYDRAVAAHPRACAQADERAASGSMSRPVVVCRRAEGDLFLVDRRGAMDAELTFDGEALTTTYPDLELTVTRAARLAAPLVFAQLAPHWLPPREWLDGIYAIVDTDEGFAIVASLPSGDSLVRIEYGLDDRDRVDFVSVRIGEHAPSSLMIRYEGDRMALYRGPKPVGAAFDEETADLVLTAADEPASAFTGRDDFTVVQVPVMVDGPTEGARAGVDDATPTRQEDAQQLAALAALGRSGAVDILSRAASRPGGLRRGELVLGLHALPSADASTRAELLGSVARDDRFVRYARAIGSPSSRRFRGLTGEPGLVGFVSRYRDALEALERETPDMDSAFASLLEQRHDIRYVAVAAGAALDRLQYRVQPEAIRLLEQLESVPAFEVPAKRRRAHLLSYDGSPGPAQALFLSALDIAFREQRYVTLDHRDIQVLSGNGRTAMGDAFLTGYAGRLAATADPLAMIALLETSRRANAAELSSIAASHLATMRTPSTADTKRLAKLLLEAGQTDAAETLLERFPRETWDAELLQLSAVVLQAEGRWHEAAQALETAQTKRTATVELSVVREEMQQLFELRALAAPEGIADDSAFAVLRSWRAIDPDNPAIDELYVSHLQRSGEVEEALRHATSIADRAPGDGEAFAQAARAVIALGHEEMGRQLYQQAAELEPTNPTWVLVLAQSLAARGQIAEAREALKPALDRSYQDRFSTEAEALRGLYESLQKQP